MQRDLSRSFSLNYGDVIHWITKCFVLIYFIERNTTINKIYYNHIYLQRLHAYLWNI